MEKTSSIKVPQLVISSFLVLLCYSSIQTGAQAYHMCPKVSSQMVGACMEDCSTDSDCTGGTMCCSNGCGHTCTTPMFVPYHPPPLSCPSTPPETAGICSEECGSGCTGSGELCCSNGCGHSCMQGVAPSPLCSLIREGLLNGTGLIGAYIPQCEQDGSFSQHQCHSSTGYCWCVDTGTGFPISDQIRFKLPHCNCSYGGKVYTVGDTFSIFDNGYCGDCMCNVTGGVHCVYSKCKATALASTYYSCPSVRAKDGSDSGSCDSTCSQHSDCTSPLHCCSNGCGKSCVQPSRIPYIELSVNSTISDCPAPSSVPCLNREEEEEDDDDDNEGSSCLNKDNMCQSGTRCCENSCSAGVCLSTADSTPCFTAVQITLQSNSSLQLLGRFTPLCTTQGLFHSIQCHEHYCWCVDVHSGRPLSDLVSFEQANVLKCAACVYNGVEYKHRETFPSGDSCNTCTCIGGTVSCSRVDCVEYDEVEGHGGRWYSVLIACVIIVVVLVAIVLALLVGVMMLMKQNSRTTMGHRHRRLKEEAVMLEDHEMVEYCGDHESVELKVPVEDTVRANSCAT